MGFLGSLLFKNHQEKAIAGIAIAISGAQMLLALVYAAYCLVQGIPFYEEHLLTIYQNQDFKFGLDVFYDKTTAVYTIVAAVIIFIISVFSKTYLHRESGFKRFYNHAFLFNTGLHTLLLAGNFEFLFLGWEIVGISSFLLIAFYRDRYLPVRNAMKVLSFYRIGDVALLGAIWFSHHLFHTNIIFENLSNHAFILEAVADYPTRTLMVGLLFLVAASVKSAQLPFSVWLPRAMEGPTVSSALFYGSLSVHIGVYLLLRVYPVWEPVMLVKVLVIIIGLSTAIVGSMISQVQATAKTQIAYSSLAQIGLIFVEIALGWHYLALLHFAANAFLRTYQLLVSPSVMSYLIHEQFYSYNPNKSQPFSFLPKKLYYSLYMLSVKEYNLDTLWYQYMWLPFKKAGRSLHPLRSTVAEIIFIVLMVLGGVFYLLYPTDAAYQYTFIAAIYGAISLILVLIAATERFSAIRAWIYVAMSQVFFMLSIVQQHRFHFTDIVFYLSGTVGAFAGGLLALNWVKTKENTIHLNEFHGHIYEHPNYALLFLVSALTIVGFPISPTFLGFDILFSEIEFSHRLLLVLNCLTFVVLEIAVLRIYARVFLGQHIKTYHEVAFRSS